MSINFSKTCTYATIIEYVRQKVTGSMMSQEYSNQVSRPTKPN